MPQGYLLSERAIRQLQEDHLKLQSQFANLAQRLSNSSIRRHQGAYLPEKRVRFRNDNSGTVPAYGVLRPTGATTVGGRRVVTVDQPNASFYRRCLVNGPRPVATGKYGWATRLSEGGPVLYESGTPAFGESWGPKSGQWSLAKWRYGFTIDGANDTDALTTQATQEAVNLFWGQTDGPITNGATNGVVEVYDGNDAIVTSTTVTGVKNKSGIDIGDNKKVWVSWVAGAWHVTSAECG